ncbi:VWA domain-containing protein [Hymenobacter busanensis]|uniref:VWA domain-containing protein n=1 Tax=Hymenobacter busanensis TaxID=2607656 RepID=A0A7L5A389_9BACT|nr:VWA domain-containing protein [Hymenobacter busanensis]QHJ09646.1 VWA domain-containing protein [Hymenobacter busanensis]
MCLLVGAGYAALLYSKKAPWSKPVNYGLAFLRFALVSLLCWLLLGPVLRSETTTTEAPVVVLAVDDSQSVPLFSPDSAALRRTLAGLDAMTARLREAGYDVAVRTLDTAAPARLAATRFRQPATNLDRLLTDLQTGYEGRNLAAVVLASDGLANEGRPPVFAEFTHPVYALALGDTIPRRDLRVTDLRYNRVAFSGNRFPVEAEIGYDGFTSGAATVLLRENGRVLARQQVKLLPNRRLQRTTFTLTAAAPGKHRYEVLVEQQPGEFTVLNNTRNAYIDIVKGRLRVLLAGAAPHPDLKAMRAALLGNDNFDVTLVLPGLAPLRAEQDYDVAILHQLPSRTDAGRDVLQYVRSRKLPTLYVLGAQSDFGAYNNLGTGLHVSPRGSQTEDVTPAVNPSFSRFTLEPDAVARLRDYPPTAVPAGDARLGSGAEVILYQQAGRTRTTRPLLAVAGPTGQRQATLLTDGSWQWRLQEAATHADRADTYDRLITRLLQLLTQDSRRKRLDVYPTQDAFSTQDDVTFGAETYNAVFERVYGQQISLTLTDEQNRPRSFNFTNRQDGGVLHLGPLPGGLYRYTARATVAGQPQEDRGEVLVQDQQLEATASHADHNTLYQLAQRSGGQLYYPQQLQQLEQRLLQAKFKPVLHTQEEEKNLIDEWWLFALIMALATAEWAIRRYSGSI